MPMRLEAQRTLAELDASDNTSHLAKSACSHKKNSLSCLTPALRAENLCRNIGS
jgi:hypothetical protein